MFSKIFRIVVQLLLIASVFVGCKDNDEEINNQNAGVFERSDWEINLGRDTTIPFFPDGKSNYFTYAFQRDPNTETIIKLKGKFPEARYFSIIVYDNDSRDPVGILRDFEISATSNNANPFQTQSYVSDQEYEIHIGPSFVTSSGLSNWMSFDQSITNLSVFIRYYLPESDDFGGVELPIISAMSPTNDPVAPPSPESLEELVEIDDIVSNLELMHDVLFFGEPSADRYFFRVSGSDSGNYANPDNAYLISASTLINDQVILLRWKAPSVAENFSDFNTYDMRYLSVGLSDVSSFNYETLSDTELHVASDGYINLVVARQNQEIIDHANGLNYLAWDPEIGDRGYILYRNMLTNSSFENSIDRCPIISENFVGLLTNPENLHAALYIDEFAPSGKVMSKAEFLDDFGGLTVSY